MTIAEKHNHAIDLAEEAFAFLDSNMDQAIMLFKEAYEIEKNLAEAIDPIEENEPSRSIFFRSAASLALNAKLFRESEIMVSKGLIGYPPDEIANELRDIFDQVNFERHLSVEGVSLNHNQVQLSFVGNDVGYGYIRSSELISRIEIFTDIAKREVEKRSKKQFRIKGRPGKVVEMYPTYIRAQMAGSYKVILQIGQIEKDYTLSLFKDNFSIEENIIDSILADIELINQNDISKLSENYTEEQKSYFDFFLSSIKTFAPDGDKIKMIGLTVIRNGKEQKVMFNRKRSEIRLTLAEPNYGDFDFSLDDAENPYLIVEGILDLAQSKPNSKYIEVTDEKNETYKFEISEGKLAAIVRDNYEDRVRVTGIKKKSGKKQYFQFVDIENIN